MSRVLLQAAPSAPSDTLMPRARISVTGAMPGSQLQIRAGAVEHLDGVLGEQGLLGVAHVHAMRGAQPWGSRVRRRSDTPDCPCRSTRGPRRFLRAVRRRACARAGRARRESDAVASSSSREQEIAKRGASAVRSRPFAAPCHCRCSAIGSRRGRRARPDAAAPALRRARPSGICRPWRAVPSAPALRTPPRFRAPSPSSAPTSCRPAAARPPRVARWLPAWLRRAPLRAARCAGGATQAAAGRRPIPGTSVWHRWMWVWTKPGRTRAPEASIVVAARAPSGTWPTAAIRSPSMNRSPSTTSKASFIVTIVA